VISQFERVSFVGKYRHNLNVADGSANFRVRRACRAHAHAQWMHATRPAKRIGAVVEGPRGWLSTR
jgi:hypothetical protein